MQIHWDEDRAHHWHLFSPPARPSPGEVAVYEREALCTNVPRGRWGLLGCTPELRSLAARHGGGLVCIDWNVGVYRVLRALVDGEVDESFVCASWLEAEIESPVALIFADGSLNMLPSDQHVALMERTAHLLAPGGVALMRVHVATAPHFRTPAEVFAAARSRSGIEGVFTATRTDLDMLWLDPETLILDFEVFHQQLNALRDQGLITATEYDPYARVLQWNRIRLHYTTSRRFEEIAARHFTIVRCQAGGDYTRSDQHPVYTLVKK